VAAPLTAPTVPIQRRPATLFVAVGLAAVVVYLGALANRFALDDLPLIVNNGLVATPAGLWHAFVAPLWPPELGGAMYRPLPMASWVLDHLIDGAPWYHLVNLLWHAAAAVAVAALARRFADDRTAFAAGLLFAVHPVHVEAVANVVGRAELMAALFVVLAAFAALVSDDLAWSAVWWALGLLCKENAAVLPGLVVWGWILGLARPSRRRMVAYAASWVAVAAAYAGARWIALHHYEGWSLAPIFYEAPAGAIRWTALATLADVVRLLVFPLKLRVDYSPDERTLITSPFDGAVGLGLLCFAIWAGLLILAWRRGRKVEAYGLGWIGISYLPVANLLFPVGFLIAERTLYLPSVGLVLAVAAWLTRLPRWPVVLTVLVLLGGVRTALRVPAWRSNLTVTLHIMEDSPRSYIGPKQMIGIYMDMRRPERALAAARTSAGIFDRDPAVFATGAVAAFALGRSGVADSLLSHLRPICRVRCPGYYRWVADLARRRGYPAAADSLLARIPALNTP
jgi:protein O-mannosyl-transferase